MRSVFRWLGRLIGLLVAVTLLALAYLHVRGAPPFLTKLIVQQMERAGVAARFGALRLDLYRGVVATNAVFADLRQPDHPLVQIDEVQLQFSARRLIHRQNPIVALRIANANISVPTPPDENGPAYFTASSAYATFRFDEDGTIQVDRLTGVYCGLRLYVRGTVLPARQQTPVPATPSSFTFVTKIVRELNRIRTAALPQLNVDFNLDLAQPLAGKVSVQLRGDQLIYRGLKVDSATIDIRMQDGAIEIRDFVVALYRGEIKLGGRYDIAGGRFDLQLASTTDPLAFAVFAPPAVATVLREVQVRENPTFTVRYTLSPKTGNLPQLQGAVATGGLTVRGVEFRAVRFKFEEQGPDVKFTDVFVATPAGQLTGAGQYQIESSDFSYRLDSTLDPTKLVPLMMPGLRRIVEPAEFPGPPPHIVAAVQGDFVDPDNFAYDATVTAQQCRYRGVDLKAASGHLQLARQRLDVQDLRLEREEGVLTGTLRADFNTHQVRFDLATTANPSAMAPLLGEKAAQIMKSYRFGPRTQATAKGLVDFDNAVNTVWTAQVQNEGFSYWKFTAQQAQADLALTNNTFRIENFKANLYGGTLTGMAEFGLANPAAEYRFTFDVDRCDVNQVLSAMKNGQPTKVTGYLSGHVELQGRGTDTGTLVGRGDLKIADGVLWEAPLFGIFSRALGNTKATSAEATFTIGDGAVKTDDLKVTAGAFTGRSSGTLGFDGKIDFLVNAQFLSSWPGINIATWLLGKALEYKVGGTIGNPSYRPIHVPKELLPHE